MRLGDWQEGSRIGSSSGLQWRYTAIIRGQGCTGGGTIREDWFKEARKGGFVS
jgi:hypothetical protein